MSYLRTILILLIQLYRWLLSPLKAALFGPTGHCRFFPCCSEYALTSLRGHNLMSATWLIARRIGRCHPWSDGGYDPVPDPPQRSSSAKPRPDPTLPQPNP